MKKIVLMVLTISIWACSNNEKQNDNESQKDTLVDSKSGATQESKLNYEGEKHLKNIKQLTFGGDNAEAYFSSDEKKVVLQITYPEKGYNCDQIFYAEIVNLGKKDADLPQLISTGKGRTTCAYFMPGDTTVVFASTHLKHDTCPPVPERKEEKYVWPIYPEYDIFVADLKGNIIKQLTDLPGYDAEATVSPKGDKIVFTSTRSGDIELYTMNIDGSNVKQITNELGYDGGAFFSHDGSKLVFRASRPKTKEEVKLYKELLAINQVQPLAMELFVCNVDGSELTQVTKLGGANWAPFFHPSDEKILFSTNHHSEKFFPLNLFMINIDGTGLEQITYDHFFDAFPMFSKDGKKLIFSSNRNNNNTHATNLFIADWED